MATGQRKKKTRKPGESPESFVSGLSLTTKQDILHEELERHEKEPKNLLSVSPASSSKHEFSSPWQNSDLVLIIENQKIHVHRVILEMTSPVLCHIFKETDSNEVPLLRTKVSDFVDLLRVIYPQFKNKIALDNIEHIYRLAEEYQIESVVEICREYLTQVKKTTTNAMKILVTSQVCDADEARKQCYEVLKHLTVAELKSDEHFEDLEEKSMRNVLLPKAERLEKCLREIQPQLVGLIDCVLYLWFHNENKEKMRQTPQKCPVHYQFSWAASIPMQTRIQCSLCQKMLHEMARFSTFAARSSLSNQTVQKAYYSQSAASEAHFDYKIVNVLQEMFSLLKM